MGDDDLLNAVLAEYQKVSDQVDHVDLRLSFVEAWTVMSLLKVAGRLPRNVGPAQAIGEMIAMQIQDRIAVTPALLELARRIGRE